MKPCYLLALALATAGTAAAENAPKFKVTTRKADDRVEFQATGDKVTFSVKCPSGIGGATIERVDSKWPEAVVLRLHLKGLESLAITSGKVKLSGAVSSERKVRVWKDDKEDELLKPTSPFWMDIRIVGADGKPAKHSPVENGYFEMILPKAMFEGNPKSVILQWIDLYRG